MTKSCFPILLSLLLLPGCYKPMNLEEQPVPGNTLILEFAQPVKYAMELKIDGKVVPIRYAQKNRVLRIEGLKPGKHYYNIHSISYVFGPEYNEFRVDGDTGAHFFIQGRKYRSALPKNRAQVSIRAYRKKLKKEGIDVKARTPGKIHAFFSRS